MGFIGEAGHLTSTTAERPLNTFHNVEDIFPSSVIPNLQRLHIRPDLPSHHHYFSLSMQSQSRSPRHSSASLNTHTPSPQNLPPNPTYLAFGIKSPYPSTARCCFLPISMTYSPRNRFIPPSPPCERNHEIVQGFLYFVESRGESS